MSSWSEEGAGRDGDIGVGGWNAVELFAECEPLGAWSISLANMLTVWGMGDVIVRYKPVDVGCCCMTSCDAMFDVEPGMEGRLSGPSARRMNVVRN